MKKPISIGLCVSKFLVSIQSSVLVLLSAFHLFSTETPMNLDGFKSQMDMLKWIVEKATHNYSTSDLTMQLELEANITELEDLFFLKTTIKFF